MYQFYNLQTNYNCFICRKIVFALQLAGSNVLKTIGICMGREFQCTCAIFFLSFKILTSCDWKTVYVGWFAQQPVANRLVFLMCHATCSIKQLHLHLYCFSFKRFKRGIQPYNIIGLIQVSIELGIEFAYFVFSPLLA